MSSRVVTAKRAEVVRKSHTYDCASDRRHDVRHLRRVALAALLQRAWDVTSVLAAAHAPSAG